MNWVLWNVIYVTFRAVYYVICHWLQYCLYLSIQIHTIFTLCISFVYFFIIGTIASSGPILITLIVSLTFSFKLMISFTLFCFSPKQIQIAYRSNLNDFCLFVLKWTLIVDPCCYLQESRLFVLSHQVQGPWVQGSHGGRCLSQVFGFFK